MTTADPKNPRHLVQISPTALEHICRDVNDIRQMPLIELVRRPYIHHADLRDRGNWSALSGNRIRQVSPAAGFSDSDRVGGARVVRACRYQCSLASLLRKCSFVNHSFLVTLERLLVVVHPFLLCPIMRSLENCSATRLRTAEIS